jgi:hypothetical protein
LRTSRANVMNGDNDGSKLAEAIREVFSYAGVLAIFTWSVERVSTLIVRPIIRLAMKLKSIEREES